MTKYHRVTWAEAQANPEYWQLVRCAYEKENSSELLQELTDASQAMQHASKIKAGAWQALDFNDSEFERNIYHALRLNLISLDQLSTALILHAAKEEFAGDEVFFHQYNLDGAGPYDPSTAISYATPAKISKFKQDLTSISPEDCCYFTIQLPIYREIALAFDLLNAKFNARKVATTPALSKLVLAIIKKHTSNDLDLEKLINLLSRTSDINQRVSLFSQIKARFDAAIKTWSADIYQWLQTDVPENIAVRKTRDSARFLAALIAENEPFPHVEFEKDNNLCVILPTMSAMRILQTNMQGKGAALGYFNAGSVSMEMVRFLDENPAAFNLTQQARPIEIEHPDLPLSETADGFMVHKFMLAYHDIFHCWRNGNVINKEANRHVRQLLASATGEEMSDSIWTLSDMDFTGNWSSSDKAAQRAFSTLQFAQELMMAFIPNNRDGLMLVLADLIINEDKWKALLGIDNFSSMLLKAQLQTNELDGRVKELINTFAQLTELKNILPNASVSSTSANITTQHLLYAIRYKLGDLPIADAICSKLVELDLTKIIQLDPKGNLKFANLAGSFVSNQPLASDAAMLLAQLLAVLAEFRPIQKAASTFLFARRAAITGRPQLLLEGPKAEVSSLVYR